MSYTEIKLIALSPPDFISPKTRNITLCVWSDLDMVLSRSCFLFVRNLVYFCQMLDEFSVAVGDGRAKVPKRVLALGRTGCLLSEFLGSSALIDFLSP